MLRGLGIFSLFAMPAIGVAVFVCGLVRLVLDFRGAKKGRGHLVFLWPVGSLALWAVVSVAVCYRAYILFVSTDPTGGARQEAHAKAVALLLFAFCVIYAVGGWLTAVRWWRDVDDDEPAEIFPKGAA